MRFDIVTIFPDFFTGPLDYGIVRRARESNLIQIEILDLRKFTHDKHQTVDDRPFGGGEGMVLKAEPLFDAVESLVGPQPDPPAVRNAGTAIVLLSAAGKLFDQAAARRLAQCERVILLCGRYEGVDERVAEHLATDELSIGNFVLSGGELAAALVLDTVVRLLPGALGNEDSALNESFSEQATDSAGAVAAGSSARGLLVEGPHYTRPENFRGWKVPAVLMSGNHQEIAKWRQEQSEEKTKSNRPDLLKKGRSIAEGTKSAKGSQSGKDSLQRIVGAQLSSVQFVMDYLIVGFGPQGALTALVWPEIHDGNTILKFGLSDYRNRLCELIEQVVSAAELTEDETIVIAFANGAVLRFRLRDWQGGERAILTGPKNALTVW